jgi:hypothetical protein
MVVSLTYQSILVKYINEHKKNVNLTLLICYIQKKCQKIVLGS